MNKIQAQINKSEREILKASREEYLGHSSDLFINTAKAIKINHQNSLSLIKTIVEDEIRYWKDIFDKRPKDRDLESDEIAQNFARIEIERWEKFLQDIK